MNDRTTTAAEPSAANEDESITLDIGSQAGAAEEEVRTTGTIRGKVDQRGVATGTGRRKTSVARVRIQNGSGKLSVNDRQLEEFFPVERDRQMILAPLQAADALKNVDVWIRVDGGGPTGQAGAVVLGIARALQARNPELHHALSEGGFLTRDGRMVERKKYGKKKARRSFQFSKR
jgi:small subunit ribosomal protein S9